MNPLALIGGLTIQAKLIIISGLIALTLFVGFKTGYSFAETVKDAEIAQKEALWNTALNKAKDARLAEEMLSRAAESRASSAIHTATTTFEEVRQNENAIKDRRITDLLNDVTRLRVSTRRPDRGSLPEAPATAGSSDGENEALIDGSVAARLSLRYSEYNEAVDRLELCQATINVYQATVK